MSGIVNRIRLDRVRDVRVDYNVYLGGVLPAGHHLKGSISLIQNGPPLFLPPDNVGPLGPNQNVYFTTGSSLAPDTTYWLRVWHEDGVGNVLGEASRWVTTFPAGSVDAAGVPFVSCGFNVDFDQERVSWGYNDVGYGHKFKSDTVATPTGGLGEEVA